MLTSYLDADFFGRYEYPIKQLVTIAITKMKNF